MLQRGTAPAVRVQALRIPRPARALVRRLTGADRRALGCWAGAHLALAVTAWITAWAGGTRSIYTALIGIYDQWDVLWYQTAAGHGYFSGQSGGTAVYAFSPGTPAAMASLHLVVRNWAVAGLLVSLIAGSVAVVYLSRLAGDRAVLYLLAAPAAMYLMVGYSEALFLALALPAWAAAKRRDWPVAALLAGIAGLVRVEGLFLIAALLMMAALGRRGKRMRAVTTMSLALAGPALFELYLRDGTGTWTAWFKANRAWGVQATNPWRTFTNTWNMAFGHALAPNQAAMFQIEIACMAAGLALTAVLAWRRAWPETVYCGLTFAVLATSGYYQSTPRALLVSWPLYLLVAKAAERRPWVGHLYLWVCVPLAVLVAVGFFDGLWAV